MLTQSGIADYLLSLGVVKPHAVVEDGLVVRDVSRRNRVFIADGRTGAVHVVKQADLRGGHTLAHEAAVLRALAGIPRLAALVPAVVHHDPEAALLVLCTPAGGRDWSEYHDSGRFPVAPARALGQAIAALHELPPDGIEDLPPESDRLWGLSLPEPAHELLLDLSAAAADLVARVQAREAMGARLRELREALSDDAFVHGDLRWENCVLLDSRAAHVLLVDWELAGRGPAAVDVGTALAEYLIKWVASIPILEPRDPSRFVHRAAHPLDRMRPAIRAFWTAYRAGRTRAPALPGVVELAAVRLLQAAVERAQRSAATSAHVVVLVQLADNLLRDPEDAALSLLGLHA